jgi:uncharacterized protein (TIGR03790 family)
VRRLALICLLLICAPALARLTPEQLLLVANKNLPDSVELAQHYAAVRGLVAKQILLLDLPVNERILPLEYQKRLAAPVSEYLKSPAGEGVRCVVLFYGVPLRVMPEESSRDQRAEMSVLRRVRDALDARTPQVAQDAETFAQKFGVKPRAVPGKGASAAQVRVISVMEQLQQRAASLTPEDRAEIERWATTWQEQLVTIARTEPGAAAGPATLPAVPELTVNEVQALANQPRDAESRDKVRRFIAARSGAFELSQVIDNQLAWTTIDETDASVDSELSLVLFPDYPRFRWQPNPLQRPQTPGAPRAVMTCRIDGPTPQIARRIVDNAVEVEKRGLRGTAVFDSRGLPEKKGNTLDGYGWYDQAIRDAAAFVSGQTALKVYTDDRPQVILPNTVDDVATYIGWYSLQNYVPGSKFVPGAVGYHVASLELTSLRNPASKEWVANLLRDGVDATLGAVSEPYLHSFPRPEEFFPILYTGEYTLAETYWLTVPMTSWKLSLIGDPLYRPYAAEPALKLDQLPEAMRTALKKIEVAAPNGR